MSKKPLSTDIIFVVLGLLFITLIGIRTISTPTIWTHLAQGRSNAAISYIEPDSMINTTHMYDKIMYSLWNAGGAPLLIITNVLMMLAAFILLVQVSRKWGGGLSQGFALLVSGQLIFQGLDVGPQSLMMLFIALFVYLISTIERPAVLFGALIPLQILWVNMHDSFIFGPVIAVLALIQAGRPTIRKNRQGLPASLLGILVVSLLVATLFNPYFTKVYGQMLANFNFPRPFYWGSLFYEYLRIPTHEPLIFFILILGAGGLITLKKHLPLMLTTLAIIGAFLVVRSAYTARLFTVLAFPFMVLSFAAVGDYLSGSFKNLLGKQAKLLTPATQIVFVLLIILSIIPVVSNCAYARLGSASSFGLGIQDELFPSGAEALLEDPAFPDKIINLPADGGYLAFHYPERKIFLDYRSGCYDENLLVALNAMLLGDARAYDTIYDTYRPEAVILNTLSPVSVKGLTLLLSRGIWKLAYFDGVTAILLVNKEEHASLINNTRIQDAGLRRLESARAEYATKVGKGCHAIPAELVSSASVFLSFNRPAESKAIYSLLLQGNDSIPSSWLGIGNSQLMLREFDEAVKSLETATRLRPNNWFAWANYAKACNRAGKTAEMNRAIEEMKRLMEEAKKAGEEIPVEEEDLSALTEKKAKPALQDITIPE